MKIATAHAVAIFMSGFLANLYQSAWSGFWGLVTVSGEIVIQHEVMAGTRERRSPMLNPKLMPFSVLVGEWKTIGTHRLIPGTTLHGHATFDWIEDGAFLRLRTEVEEEGIPSGMFIFGSDDASELVTMLYFDERGVSRIFETTLVGNVWKFWRNAPGFSQRFTGTLADHNNTIQVIIELSEDDTNWANDLVQTYTRVQ
jgi:hypothetical protein